MFSFLNPLRLLASRRQVEGLRAQLFSIERRMMTSATELAQGLTQISTQLTKISRESTATLDKVRELEEAMSTGNVSPEIETAFQALKTQVQALDDLVPDEVDIPGGEDTLPGEDTVDAGVQRFGPNGELLR